MAKKNEHAPGGEPKFAEVMRAFATDPRVTYGRMFASTGLKVNGKICSCEGGWSLSCQGLALTSSYGPAGASTSSPVMDE